ncbi:WD repeat-containing protein 46-like [Eriocheir sinensis]|uniref:WD repeat-containing protein 46-like n=1 Tax=Eriocheir sinensis TaxID=95602 RepID=UPI0021C6CEF2|nr:WD repeat-containing protein 46-like [Eriocheir sinensis]XP_050712713.1 WD repeat-containing protein 46-like [Eriocheir sinensis]XP_050712715.1 WD repeat-containing protein 46-like [Eriocheir sinensis]XP_050712716.1 WD repeat-containing protein 46-like [Eriocheir sinensis]
MAKKRHQAGRGGNSKSKKVLKSEVKDGVRITEFKVNPKSKMKRKRQFVGRKVIDPKLLLKYTKGEGVELSAVGRKNSYVQQKIKKKEKKIKFAEQESARAEILLPESNGQLEAEEGTYTSHITQTAIKKAVDITTAAKGFDLNLDQFGPYKMHFTRNGRHLLLGGRKGHLASMDWVTKKLHCEINVMESIHDVCWLHTELMMAAAQKQWVYIYDNQGIELHCLRQMDRVLKLEFLPYHFLLCSGSEKGFLTWLDITLGKEVIRTPTHKGRLEVMCQNPYNAVLCCGHPNGTVSMWTPNSPDPVASVLCHPHPLRAIDVDHTGRYMATVGVDRQMKIWDARNLGRCLQNFIIGSGASKVAFSQKGLLSVAIGNIVEVYRNVVEGGTGEAYMRHKAGSIITDMQFCPYEDILGISTYKGYSSLIIPGAGEPNFDALEANPYISLSGRKEAEVKALLAKVPSELITLDPLSIGQVDTPTLQEKLEAKKALLYVQKPKIDFTPRYRMKGKSGSAQKFKRKQKVREDTQREYLKTAYSQKEELNIVKKSKQQSVPPEILDRFKPKKKVKKS